jgi:hypothetical protein
MRTRTSAGEAQEAPSRVLRRDSFSERAMNRRFPKGGRPRLAGAREGSGRISRRITDSEKERRLAQAYWRDFVLSAHSSKEPRGLSLNGWPAVHPLLNLVKLAKMDADSFIIALYWICTDFAIAPRWKSREYLTRVTGFDFCAPAGCLAARGLAYDQLGIECVKTLDGAALRGEFRTDVSTLSDYLGALWQAWCNHATSTS